MKILIDTNIWISVFINNDFQYFVKKILENDVRIISSARQIEEISKVLAKPKLTDFIDRNLISEFLMLFLKSVEIVESNVTINACRDAKDNFILEAAVSGKADFILTEDQDLLVLHPFKEIKILTMKSFYQYLKIK